MDDLSAVLPNTILQRALRNEEEFVFPYPDVLEVIRAASEHEVAVLGVELFEIQKAGLGVRDYSGYECDSSRPWHDFVRANNDEALRFINDHRSGEEHGYILTTASQREFQRLKESDSA
ncbi:MAG: hypothetical protein KIT09_24120 [Bryobacteraceae bacterium]|nr:hypothetical protein [Bryobacteraceae bacterium]